MNHRDREPARESGPVVPDGTRPGRVALAVADLDRQVRFYRDVLGFVVRDRGAGRVALGTDREALLELRAAPDAAARTGSEAGLYHVAFLLPDRGTLAEVLRRVRDRWQLDGASDHGVSEALYLTDPEGNGVELYRDRPRADWPTGPDGGLSMGVDPLDVDALVDRARGAAGVPPATTVGHVHLAVGELLASERFYADSLGLRVRQRYADAALFLAAGDYHHHLGLNTWEHRRDPPAALGLDWFELLLPDAANPDALATRLRDAGVAVERPGDGDAVAVTDPAGIELRLRPR